MSGIIELDKAVFETINGSWSHPWLDQWMPILTDLHRVKWLTFGLLPLLFALWVYKQRAKAIKTIVLIAFSIALSDMVAYRIVKPLVNRERPEFSGVAIQLRSESHSGRSFPSNHAANNFAAANMAGFVYPPARWILFAIAFVVALSRVYVGVHFPLDVLGGAALGLMLSSAVWWPLGRRWIIKNGADSSRERNRDRSS